MIDWQPIETAPKNYEYIIAWDETDGYHVVYWSRVDGRWRDDYGNVFDPTHWAPLTPPKDPTR